MALPSKAPLRPADKPHTAADDRARGVVDIDVNAGAAHDAARVIDRGDASADTLERPVMRGIADAACGVARDCAKLEPREIDDALPRRTLVRRRAARGSPIERVKYDARRDSVICPPGRC